MRNNESRPMALSNYRSMWRHSRDRPLPYRLQYSTWLEWGNYDIDGRLAGVIVYPTCVFLDWMMSWWPHEHSWYREASHRPEQCVYCRRAKPEMIA